MGVEINSPEIPIAGSAGRVWRELVDQKGLFGFLLFYFIAKSRYSRALTTYSDQGALYSTFNLCRTGFKYRTGPGIFRQ
jgi:hypothetical protein